VKAKDPSRGPLRRKRSKKIVDEGEGGGIRLLTCGGGHVGKGKKMSKKIPRRGFPKGGKGPRFKAMSHCRIEKRTSGRNEKVSINREKRVLETARNGGRTVGPSALLQEKGEPSYSSRAQGKGRKLFSGAKQRKVGAKKRKGQRPLGKRGKSQPVLCIRIMGTEKKRT